MGWWIIDAHWYVSTSDGQDRKSYKLLVEKDGNGKEKPVARYGAVRSGQMGEQARALIHALLNHTGPRYALVQTGNLPVHRGTVTCAAQHPPIDTVSIPAGAASYRAGRGTESH